VDGSRFVQAVAITAVAQSHGAELYELEDTKASPSERSDVYALSITIWEVRPCLAFRSRTQPRRQLFTLQTPFHDIRQNMTVMFKVFHHDERPSEPKDCRELGFSEELWGVVKRGWAKDPEQRPPLAVFDTVLHDLEM
jgi:hypothetical protein